MQDNWHFRESSFGYFSRGACSWSPYKIPVIGADSPLVSPVTWCLMFSDEKKKTPYLDQTNDETASGCSRSLNTEETIRKETKLPLAGKIIKSIGDQKSS